MSLKGKKLLVGLTGGIACYKVPVLVRLLYKAGAEIRVVMTEAATRFITPLTLEAVSNHPVAVALFPEGEYVATRHIDLAQWPDLTLIAPATANFVGKMASGISDDLLTTVICASPGPVMVAPAMNPQMWQQPVTQKNVSYLREIGYHIVGPEEGDTACDQWGVGRMVEPEALFDVVKAFFAKGSKKKVLEGKSFLVTAGPCREPLDPVRFISNRSSGKMGYALAAAARSLGAKTTLISGPTALKPPAGVDFITVETTSQMYQAISRRFARADCLIMAAAPADYAPETVAREKLKKGPQSTNVTLTPTVDILKVLGLRKKPGQLLIGFALETENGVRNARKKLTEKNLDLIVLNETTDEHPAFDSDTNRITLLAPGKKPEVWSLLDKHMIAVKLLEIVAGML